MEDMECEKVGTTSFARIVSEESVVISFGACGALLEALRACDSKGRLEKLSIAGSTNDCVVGLIDAGGPLLEEGTP